MLKLNNFIGRPVYNTIDQWECASVPVLECPSVRGPMECPSVRGPMECSHVSVLHVTLTSVGTRLYFRDKRIASSLEMTSGALTNPGKLVMSNIACVHTPWFTKNSVFWLAQMTLCIMALHNFLRFIGPNTISGDLTYRLWIGQFMFCKNNQCKSIVLNNNINKNAEGVYFETSGINNWL